MASATSCTCDRFQESCAKSSTDESAVEPAWAEDVSVTIVFPHETLNLITYASVVSRRLELKSIIRIPLQVTSPKTAVGQDLQREDRLADDRGTETIVGGTNFSVPYPQWLARQRCFQGHTILAI